MPEPPGEVRELASRRAEARAAGDFETADALRDRLAETGWIVLDGPDGWRLEPAEPEPGPQRLKATDVGSVLEEPATAELSIHWVCEGWPDDIVRALASFRRYLGERDVQFVVADVTGEDAGVFGDDVEVLSLEAGTGWAAARNAGLRRSRGALVFVMDGSIEAAGDVWTPIAAALADPAAGIVGPFGIVTKDLREFDDRPDPGPCDAVEGYFMAVRRETLIAAGPIDEKFRWYRTADIEYSFRVKDLGLSAAVVPRPRDQTHASDVVRDRSRRPARNGRNGTTTDSSSGGVIGGTWCSTRVRQRARRVSVDSRHRGAGASRAAAKAA